MFIKSNRIIDKKYLKSRGIDKIKKKSSLTLIFY